MKLSIVVLFALAAFAFSAPIPEEAAKDAAPGTRLIHL